MSTEFFWDMLDDIEQRIAKPSPYNLIKVSGLIRQLLFDEKSVLINIQKHFDQKFVFSVNRYSLKDSVATSLNIMGEHHMVAFSGDLDCMPIKKEVPAHEYGKLAVLYVNGTYFTVKDIIKYVANKRGGIHLDESKLDEEQKIMDEISRQFHLQNTEALFNQIYYIAKNLVNSSSKCGYERT